MGLLTITINYFLIRKSYGKKPMPICKIIKTTVGESNSVMYRVWVGKRESDIMTYTFFDESITFYGSNTGTNHSYCTFFRQKSSYSTAFSEYVISILRQIIDTHCDAEIHFYNNSFAYKLYKNAPEILAHMVNSNPSQILGILNHKTLSRLWLTNTIATPAFCSLSCKECVITNLKKKFGNYDAFVIQENISGGGNGTFLVNEDNSDIVIASLDKTKLYLVSPYYFPNKSMSCHLMISRNDVAVFPVSEQILDYTTNRIVYLGNKYLPSSSQMSMAVKDLANKVGIALQSIGYLGICGLDFIYAEKQIMLIEINPRYQGSSYAINTALYSKDIPSLFEMNDMCFSKTSFPQTLLSSIEYLEIDCINISHSFASEKDLPDENKLSTNSTKHILFTDGCLNAREFEAGAYLYRELIFNS